MDLGRGGEEASGGREAEGGRDDEVEVGENIEGFAMLSVSRSMLLLTSLSLLPAFDLFKAVLSPQT